MINIFDIKEKSGVMYLIGRDENNERVITEEKNRYSPFHGEFYIKEDSIDILDNFKNIIEFNLIDCDKKSLFGDKIKLVRYNILNFDRIGELRDLIEKYRYEIFEGDIWGRTLFCLDMLPNLNYGVDGKWRLAYIDIETEVSIGIPDANNPVDKVLCVTCYDNYEQKYHYFYWGGEKFTSPEDSILHQYTNEKEMIESYIEYMIEHQFDVVTGWNIDFDVSYILQRYLHIGGEEDNISRLSPIGYASYNEKYKQFNIWGLFIFDLLAGYKRIVRNQLHSFKLDSVAEEELGEKKVEVDIKTLKDIPKEKLFEYNKKDVELCVKIDKKMNVFTFFDGLRKFVGCCMDDTKYSRSLIDFMVLKKARTLGLVLPTASNVKGVKPEYKGAYVDAVQGSYDNVIAFDLAALYPSIIKTFNLSIEQVKEDGRVNLPEINIDMTKVGLIPNLIDDLRAMRKKYDEERDKYPAGHPEHEKNDILVESAKLVVDAIYGMCAFPNFRLYKPQIASSITYVGREIIQHTKKFIEELGHSVVVTDTDSSYFVSGKEGIDEVVKYGYEILAKVNKEYFRWAKERWGIEPDKCYLENVFKKVYKRLIVGTKKRYCGIVVWAKGHPSDKLEVVGMETKRSDYSRFARDLQYNLMGLLLNNESDEVVRSFIDNKIKEIRELPFSKIAIPTKIDKRLSEYKTNLPKVRGSKYSHKILNEEFGPGDKPLLLFTKGESDIILFYNDKQASKLLEKVKIDWEKMIDRNILKPSQMLLESDGRHRISEEVKMKSNLISTNQQTLF